MLTLSTRMPPFQKNVMLFCNARMERVEINDLIILSIHKQFHASAHKFANFNIFHVYAFNSISSELYIAIICPSISCSDLVFAIQHFFSHNSWRLTTHITATACLLLPSRYCFFPLRVTRWKHGDSILLWKLHRAEFRGKKTIQHKIYSIHVFFAFAYFPSYLFK